MYWFIGLISRTSVYSPHGEYTPYRYVHCLHHFYDISIPVFFCFIFVDLILHFTICSSDYNSMNRRCVCIFAHHFPYISSILISFYCYCNSSESFLPRLISKPTKWLKIDVKNYEVKKNKLKSIHY